VAAKKHSSPGRAPGNRGDTSGITTLGYALLGILARGPASGYDVSQVMRVPVGFFWHARHSQIYPELAALEARGLLTHTVVEQSDRPAKKVYALTAHGRTALSAWVASPLDVPAVRDELVLRASCVWLSDPAAARALFEAHAARHEQQLAEYEGYRTLMEGSSECRVDDLAAPDFATYATLMRGIGYEREYAAWCRWMADRLAAPQAAPSTEARGALEPR
jgi:DNA-binding PadR family transcriptional regulator